MSLNAHKNAHLLDINMHEVKGFPSASNHYSYRKSIKGASQWQRDYRLPNVLGQLNGYSAATTEVDGDYYAITAPEFDINNINWQSGTTVRFTFTSGYDSSLYATSSYLQVSGCATAVHNGVWVITAVNASYLEVTNASVTDATDDETGSAGVGYVTHQSYDPENLGNAQSIPRQGIVYYDGTADLWYGDSFTQGDTFFDVSTLKLASFNGTDIIDEGGILSKKITLTAAQLLAATQVTIEEAAGVGYIIEPISCIVDYTHVTTDYDTGQDIQILNDTASKAILTTTLNGAGTNGVLNQTASSFSSMKAIDSVLVTQYITNKALVIKANASSGSGDGTAIAYVTYRIIKQ